MDRSGAFQGIGAGLLAACVAILVFGLTFVVAVFYIA